MLKDPLNTFNGYIKVLECVSYMVFPEKKYHITIFKMAPIPFPHLKLD